MNGINWREGGWREGLAIEGVSTVRGWCYIGGLVVVCMLVLMIMVIWYLYEMFMVMCILGYS